MSDVQYFQIYFSLLEAALQRLKVPKDSLTFDSCFFIFGPLFRKWYSNYVQLCIPYIFVCFIKCSFFYIENKMDWWRAYLQKTFLRKGKKIQSYWLYKIVYATPFQCIFKDGPDKLTITPEPILNNNGQLKVRKGDTIGPFVCSADCNPPCNITWRVKYSDGFSDVPTEMGTVLQQAVQRNTLLFLCISNWEKRILQQGIQLDVQCKYLIKTRTV